jgi:hypothetical protein
MAILSPSQKGLLSLAAFRKQMSSHMIIPILEEYFLEEDIQEFKQKYNGRIRFRRTDKIQKDKIKFVRNALKLNKLFESLGVVKYVGISGSIAARTFLDGEDIDLFIVVANDTSWIYRGFLKLILGTRGRLYSAKNVANTLCVNFIVEERGLLFDKNVFNFHEMLHLINVVNPEYKNKVLAVNQWLNSEYGVEQNLSNKVNIKRNRIIRPINHLAYFLQYQFMKLMKHEPSSNRIERNYKKGKIAFYPENFRQEIQKDYELAFKELAVDLPASTTSTSNTATTEATSSKASATPKSAARRLGWRGR